jgi:hypothetical protein
MRHPLTQIGTLLDMQRDATILIYGLKKGMFSIRRTPKL